MRQRIFSTSRTVLASFLLILAIVVGMFGYLAWDEYRRAKIETDELVTSRVQLVSTHAEWLVNAGRQTLDAVDRLAGGSFATISTDKATDIAAIVAALPGSATLSFFDPQGKAVFSTAKKPSDELLADVPEILGIKADGEIHVSAMSTRNAVEAQYFAISRPVRRDGKILGIASLHVSVDVMLSLWSSVNLGPQSTIGLIRNDGWLVARYPAPDEPVNLSSYELFNEHLRRADQGVYYAKSAVDGVNRVVAFRRVPNAPLIAVASADQKFANQPLRRYFYSLATLLAGLLAIVTAVIFWASNLLAEDDRRKAELAENVEKQTLLLGEIHHRVKNNLQAVASLIQLQPMDADAKRDMRLRIAAMGAVHEQSYRLEQFAELDIQNYLRTLIENAQKSHGEQITINAELTSMTISRDVALPLGLIVNEVISNAAKHAFKDQPSPAIKITLTPLDGNQAQIAIHDNGTGYSPQEKTNGMGSRLIKAFAQQLGGTYTIENSNGTLFRMTFPVLSEGTVTT